jgi:hypothetical protein
MSAADALRAAQAAGITVTLAGECILLEANAEPPQALLEALARHKPAILDLLTPGPDGWCAADWGAYFDERVRSSASQNRYSRTQAATVAFECCVVEWLNRHPAPSAPGRCASCGKAECPSAVVLPFGTEPETHTWLHAECWGAWHEARRMAAIAALGAMGIVAIVDDDSACGWR